jgi:hypothetical protein
LYTTISRQGGTVRLLHLTKRITELLSIAKLPSWFLSSCEPWSRPRDWNTAMWFAFSILLFIVIMIVWTLGTAPRLMPGR